MNQISFDVRKLVRPLYLVSRFGFSFILHCFDLDTFFLALELKERAKQAYMNLPQELKVYLSSV